MNRLDDMRLFYNILDALEHKLGGKRLLANCNGRMKWPRRGVYFFFETGENRTQSGEGARVVRMGTHALTSSSQTTLWKRLSQHQGTLKNGGGNHRNSIFRFHVGAALIKRDAWPETIEETWGKGSITSAAVRQAELPLEQAVSQYIRQMPFLWLAVEDAPSSNSQRGVVYRNAIALLSNFNTMDDPYDPSGPNWLGRWADTKICSSGLWNVKHITDSYDPAFLEILEKLVNRIDSN